MKHQGSSISGENESCEKTFSNSLISNHEGKSHTCHICEKTFTASSLLALHVQTVHDFKKKVTFECSQCDKSYKCLKSYSLHIKSFHQGREFQCDLCNKKFSVPSKLRNHMEIVHL